MQEPVPEAEWETKRGSVTKLPISTLQRPLKFIYWFSFQLLAPALRYHAMFHQKQMFYCIRVKAEVNVYLCMLRSFFAENKILKICL